MINKSMVYLVLEAMIADCFNIQAADRVLCRYEYKSLTAASVFCESYAARCIFWPILITDSGIS